MIQWLPEIQTKFNRVIEYSQGIINPKTDPLFEQWAKEKMPFYRSMNNELIYECPEPIVLNMDEEAKKTRLQNFLVWVESYSETMSDFIRCQGNSIYSNKVESEFWHNGETIPIGMRINKAIGRYWADELDSDEITSIQNELSRIIQENKVSGKLCISIHPLDFLSASENTHNWRSCHALDGEYRAGNLSYMLDGCTIMAYIKSSEDVILPRFPDDVPWNNKKWRCFFFFDFVRGMVYAGRQYPFFSEKALNAVRDIFDQFNYFIGAHLNWTPVWKHNVAAGAITSVETGARMYLGESHIAMFDTLIPLSNWIKDDEESMHFNDLLKSSVYYPWTLVFGNVHKKIMWQAAPLVVGRSIPCLKCGKTHSKNHVCNSDVMFCYECALDDEDLEVDWITNCSLCGTRILLDEAIVGARGHLYCIDCMEENAVECSICGEQVADVPDAYRDTDGSAICECCYETESIYRRLD